MAKIQFFQIAKTTAWLSLAKVLIIFFPFFLFFQSIFFPFWHWILFSNKKIVFSDLKNTLSHIKTRSYPNFRACCNETKCKRFSILWSRTSRISHSIHSNNLTSSQRLKVNLILFFPMLIETCQLLVAEA